MKQHRGMQGGISGKRREERETGRKGGREGAAGADKRSQGLGNTEGMSLLTG